MMCVEYFCVVWCFIVSICGLYDDMVLLLLILLCDVWVDLFCGFVMIVCFVFVVCFFIKGVGINVMLMWVVVKV